MIRRIVRIICIILMAFAFCLMVYTAGASDAYELEYSRFVIQIMISIGAMGIGAIGLKVTE